MADHDAAKNDPPQLMELIEAKGFMPRQVFLRQRDGIILEEDAVLYLPVQAQERSAPDQGG